MFIPQEVIQADVGPLDWTARQAAFFDRRLVAQAACRLWCCDFYCK